MASVIEYIECPNCKQEAYLDFYYKTGEEYTTCNNCGYFKEITLKDLFKPLNEVTADDWAVEELTNPYGAYKIRFKGGPGVQCGSLVSEEDFNDFKESVTDHLDIEQVSVSRLVDGKIVTEIIIDNGPETDSAGFTAEDR